MDWRIGVLCMIHTEPAHREQANVVRTRTARTTIYECESPLRDRFGPLTICRTKSVPRHIRGASESTIDEKKFVITQKTGVLTVPFCT